MNKINNFIKCNLNVWLGSFILLHPIIDLITGICLHVFNLNLTFGTIIRVLFLLFIMYISTFVYKNKKSLTYYFIFFTYSLLYLISIFIFKDGIGLFAEVQGLIKTFYFPILLLSLYELKDEIKISKVLLTTTLGLYLICIFIPILFNVGYQSYQITKQGTLGFYNSANEISGIISILTPIVFIIFKEQKSLFLKLLFALIYLVVIFTVGTKTPLLSLVITIGMIFLWVIISCIKEKMYKPLFYSLGAILVGIVAMIMVIPETNFYKNIKTHLDFLKVDSIVEIVKDEELIDHFIFSQRLTFWNNREKLFEDVSLYEKMVGIGYLNNGKTSKLVEMDYVDIYYSHGIIGFIIFFGAYFYVLVKTFKTKKGLDFERYMTLVSFVLILFLSLFTGHIITSPAVSLIVIAVILSLDNSAKKRLLFTINTLDIGGIETAIINLTNNINYNKYKVTLIMEQKTGILLSKVNKNVLIKEVAVSNNSNVIIRKLVNFSRQLWFHIFNYHTYDFSCCYATYSLSGNKLSRIASNNNSLYVHGNYKYIYPEEKEMKTFFDIRSIKEFNKLIFVSNESKEDFLKFYPQYRNKTVVYNNFVDCEKITSLSKKKIDENKPKNKKLFVFVGRLDDSSKKVGRAINLVKEIKNIELWIIGDGPDRKMYEEQVSKNKLEKNIKFFGSKTNPYPYIALADYIILTSDYEGFPVTYLEAITLEKPIITTINVSDDKINIGKDYGYIISKKQDILIREVKDILDKPKKIKKTDLQVIQKERMNNLEKVFDEEL